MKIADFGTVSIRLPATMDGDKNVSIKNAHIPILAAVFKIEKKHKKCQTILN